MNKVGKVKFDRLIHKRCECKVRLRGELRTVLSDLTTQSRKTLYYPIEIKKDVETMYIVEQLLYNVSGSSK